MVWYLNGPSKTICDRIDLWMDDMAVDTGAQSSRNDVREKSYRLHEERNRPAIDAFH